MGLIIVGTLNARHVILEHTASYAHAIVWHARSDGDHVEQLLTIFCVCSLYDWKHFPAFPTLFGLTRKKDPMSAPSPGQHIVSKAGAGRPAPKHHICATYSTKWQCKITRIFWVFNVSAFISSMLFLLVCLVSLPTSPFWACNRERPYCTAHVFHRSRLTPVQPAQTSEIWQPQTGA